MATRTQQDEIALVSPQRLRREFYWDIVLNFRDKSMRSAFTSIQLTTLREHPQKSLYFCSVHQPRVVWSGSLAEVTNSYPGSAIQASGTHIGHLGDVARGYTLRIGSETGKDDYGKLRIRQAPTAGSLLATAEYGSGLNNLQANAILSIVEEIRPVAIHPRYDATTSAWSVDYQIYNNETRNFGPMALLGPPAVVWLEGATTTACYVGDRSYSFTGGASITSQTWTFPNGVTVSSALGSSQTPVEITYTNASSGGRYHALAVTDGNGASHIGYRLTFAFNLSNAQPARVGFDQISGGLRAGGYSTRLLVYENATSAQFPEGAEIVIFERASYAGAGQSIGGNFFARDNIVMRGWIAQDSTRIDPFTGEVSFVVNTINAELEKTDSYDIFLESGSAASAWDMASGLTIDKSAIHIAKHRSTISNITDVNFVNSMASNNEILFQSLAKGSLWAQLVENYGARGMLGIVAADLQSSLYMQLDAQIHGASAQLPSIMAVERADRRDSVVIEHDHQDIVSQYQLYAVAGETPYGAISPGDPSGYYGGRQEIARGLTTDTQDRLITWSGNIRARDNNPYKRVVIPLTGNIRLDPVPQCRFTMSLSPTQNLRGINWSNRVLLPYEMNINYNAQAQYATAEIVAETSVDGHGGSAITFPAIEPLPPENPDPIPPPGGGAGGGNTVYFVDQLRIGRTRNWNSTSPNWSNVTGAIQSASANLSDFVLDPYNPKNIAWATTWNNGVWRTTNLDSDNPTWSNILTNAAIATAIGDTVYRVQRIDSSITNNGSYSVYLTSAIPAASNFVMRTSNSGGSWTTALIAVPNNQNDSSAIEFSNHSQLRILVGISDIENRDEVWRSTDGGSSFSRIYNPAQIGQPVDILIPYANNGGDDIVFMVSRAGSGVWKSSNGGVSFTDVSPSGYNREGLGTPNHFMGSLIGGGATYYCTDGTTLFKSSDGGDTWTQVSTGYSSLGRLGLWPYNANFIYAAQESGVDQINFSVDGGYNFMNKNGDWNGAMGEGPLNAIQLVPVWTE